LLGFVMCLFLFNISIGKTEKEEIYDWLKSLESNTKKIRDIINTQESTNNNQDRKIAQIQNQVDEIMKRIDNLVEPTKEIKNITTNDHCGYVGVVKGDGIFNDFNCSKFDEAMFKLDVNGSIAYFEPIDLSRIKCIDNIELAIEGYGCERKDAQSMNVKKGRLIKESGGTWRVDEKAKVEFIK